MSHESRITSQGPRVSCLVNQGALCAFTIIELLLVIGIMSMMMVIAVPSLRMIRGNAPKVGASEVASLISLYYYLYVIREMYVTPADETSRVRVPLLLQGAVLVLGFGVFFVGLYPAPWFDITDKVSKVLFS